MEIRFECECYERTLVVEVPKRCRCLERDILKSLDQYYDEWVCCEIEETEMMCLEEYMMYKLADEYDFDFTWRSEEN